MYGFGFLKVRICLRHVVANHDERILAVILIVALPHTKLHEAKGHIEVLGHRVGFAHLQSRVVCTPHVGTNTAETRNQMADACARQILDALSGKRPDNIVNGI